MLTQLMLPDRYPDNLGVTAHMVPHPHPAPRLTFGLRLALPLILVHTIAHPHLLDPWSSSSISIAAIPLSTMLRYMPDQLLALSNRLAPLNISALKQLGILRRPWYQRSATAAGLKSHTGVSGPLLERLGTACTGKRGVDPTVLRSLVKLIPYSSIKMELLNCQSLTNKASLIHERTVDQKLDFMCLTETWHKADAYSALNEACPPGYTYLEKARGTGRGGGSGSDTSLRPAPVPRHPPKAFLI